MVWCGVVWSGVVRCGAYSLELVQRFVIATVAGKLIFSTPCLELSHCPCCPRFKDAFAKAAALAREPRGGDRIGVGFGIMGSGGWGGMEVTGRRWAGLGLDGYEGVLMWEGRRSEMGSSRA